MKPWRLASVLAFLLAAHPCAASYSVIPTSVTANGDYGGNLVVLNDLYFPPNFTYYGTDTVTFGLGYAEPTASFDFVFHHPGDLSGWPAAHRVNRLTVAVDNNDDYTFDFYLDASLVFSFVYPALAGEVPVYPGGIQNFDTLTGLGTPPAFGDFYANHVVVSAQGGDGLYSIGEVQISSVPEFSTWSLLLVGLAGLGLFHRLSGRSRRPA